MSQISHKQLISASPGQAGTCHQKRKLDLNRRLALAGEHRRAAGWRGKAKVQYFY